MSERSTKCAAVMRPTLGRGWPALEQADGVIDTLVSEHRAMVRQQRGQMHACRSYRWGGASTIVEDAGFARPCR